MTIALITDTHFGAKNDAVYFQEYIGRFYEEVFFPYLLEMKIKTIIHLGDVSDRRKYINFLSLKHFYDVFLNKVIEYDMEIHFIVGNHDTTFKNTNSVNSLDLLIPKHPKIHIYSEVAKIENEDGEGIDLIPWINSENYDSTLEFIKNSRSNHLFGHLEVAGFAMYRGIKSGEGLSQDLFKKYDIACSGHFHHKSTINNIMYLGAPYEITWHDCDDPRGFHVIDFARGDIQFIQNPLNLFKKIYYDAKKGMKDFDFDSVKNQIVKIIVVDKGEIIPFENFIESVEKVGVLDLKIEEDFTEMDDLEHEEVKVEDTLEVLTNYVGHTNYKEDQKEILKKKITEVYIEAINKE